MNNKNLNIKKIRRLFLFSFFILNFSFLSAWDFGLLTDHFIGYGGSGGGEFEYTGVIVPRFSTPIGADHDLYLSAGFTVDIVSGDKLYFPELLRNELTLRFGNSQLQIGRMKYADTLGFIASGLFDGLQYTINTQFGIFNAGAWYTGLIFKEKTAITMTAADEHRYNSVLDYNDFFNTYFASRRLLAAIGWEHPALMELVKLKVSFNAQADLNGGDDFIHSQYLSFTANLPYKSFVFELGGSANLNQTRIETDDDTSIGLAGEFGVYWNLPTNINSRLSLTGIITSGRKDSGSFLGPFLPVTNKYMGEILEAKISGLSVYSLEYMARFHQKLSATIRAEHFIRSDLVAYQDFPLSGDSDGYFLGTEFYASLYWGPVSDIRANLGGGIFLPSLGNAAPDAEPLWHLDLSVIIGLY